MDGIWMLGVVALVVLAWACAGLRVAQEYEKCVVFRLGRLVGTRGPGLFWLMLPFERQVRWDLRTDTMPLKAQDAITKDSVTVKVDAILWSRVVDPILATIKIDDEQLAIEMAAVTSLRDLLGRHTLDELLAERESINETLRTLVDHTTEAWGIDIQRVELKDIDIPDGMQRAMAREAEAIREKRARIIKAAAEQEAAAKLAEASTLIAQSPAALELRRMQMITEVGSEQNTTTIIMFPSDFVVVAREWAAKLKG